MKLVTTPNLFHLKCNKKEATTFQRAETKETVSGLSVSSHGGDVSFSIVDLGSVKSR